MTDLTTTAVELIRLYGPLAVAVFTFLEASMLFPFLPSEAVVPAAAAVLVGDATSLATFVVAAGTGGTLGAFVPFYAFYGPGSRLVDRFGERIYLTDERVERSQRWFRKWGASSVLWGRFLPGVRSVVSVPAGAFGMHPAWFGLFTAVGTVGFYASVGVAVYALPLESTGAVARSVVVEHPVLSALFLGAVAAGSLAVTLLYRRVTAE